MSESNGVSKGGLWGYNLFIGLFLAMGIGAGLQAPIFFLVCLMSVKVWCDKQHYKETGSHKL